MQHRTIIQLQIIRISIKSSTEKVTYIGYVIIFSTSTLYWLSTQTCTVGSGGGWGYFQKVHTTVHLSYEKKLSLISCNMVPRMA